MKMLFNSIAFVILMLKHNRISCATIANDNYSGESKQVLNILNDMQTDASFHNPYHHSYGHHLGKNDYISILINLLPATQPFHV